MCTLYGGSYIYQVQEGIRFKGTVQEAMADLVRALAGKVLQN